ncbi:alpha/beta fold hydrolase [Pyxidicoccus sp. 3LG]
MSGVCETNGINIHYLRTGGANPPVVLLHGLIGNGACWTRLARVLEGEVDVVMPDARGHGGSSAPHHGYRYDAHASDVVGLIRGLELSRPVLLGHSMGGMTAAVVASRGAGGIRGLILVDPTSRSYSSLGTAAPSSRSRWQRNCGASTHACESNRYRTPATAFRLNNPSAWERWSRRSCVSWLGCCNSRSSLPTAPSGPSSPAGAS